jgi:hypothetical protein
MGSALSAASLVKEHDPIALRVEKAPHPGIGTAARAAVDKHRGLAARITGFLVIDLMNI